MNPIDLGMLTQEQIAKALSDAAEAVKSIGHPLSPGTVADMVRDHLQHEFRQARQAAREAANLDTAPSPRQRGCMEAIQTLTTRLGYPPSVRELSEELGITISTVHRHLELMRDKGLVDWVDGSARTIRLTPAGMQVLAAETRAKGAA